MLVLLVLSFCHVPLASLSSLPLSADEDGTAGPQSQPKGSCSATEGKSRIFAFGVSGWLFVWYIGVVKSLKVLTLRRFRLGSFQLLQAVVPGSLLLGLRVLSR